MKHARNFFITLIIFLAIDLLWLGIIAKQFYREQIGFLMLQEVNWIAAIIFYLIFNIGMINFVINPAIQAKKWRKALFTGLFFGLITYSTYDLTNLATLTNWPILITIVDITWGTILGGITALISYFFIGKLDHF